MDAELPSDEIDELRNDITAMYDEVRGLLLRLPLDDRLAVAANRSALRGAIAQMVISPTRDARAARRFAGGHAGILWSPGRLLDVIADWRLQRVLSRATRRDLLAAWETGFNELFSSVNDAAEVELADPGRSNGRIRAIAHLLSAPARVASRVAEVQRLIEAR